MFSQLKYVRIIERPQGGFAIEARATMDADWWWVETIRSHNDAREFADDIEEDADKRLEYIEDAITDR